MLGCKPAATPIEPGNKPKEQWDMTPTDKGRYQMLVGRLIYLSHTRPDICFVVGKVSQHMHSPTNENMQGILRICRYLKASPDQGLHFKRTPDRGITIYTDADWGSSKDDLRSTTEYLSYLWSNLVNWKSKKQ